MSTVESDVNVSVPISVAYNQWTQFESFPQFMDSVEQITQINDTDMHWRVKIAGVEREFDAVITEQVPDERVAWKSVDGTTHAGVVTFHRLSDGETRVSARIDWAPEGFIEKAGALLQVDDIAIDRDLRSFKDMIEAQGLESGAWRGEVDRAPDAERSGRATMTEADRSNESGPTPTDPTQSTEDEFPGETTLHRRVRHGEGFEVNSEDEPDAQPVLTSDPMAGNTVLPGIEGHDSGPVDRSAGTVRDGADDSTATGDGRDEDVVVDTAIDPRDLEAFDIDPLADGTEVSHPVYAESDLAGEEIDLADTPVHRQPVDTDPSPKHAPEGLAGYDAPDDSPEPVIDITESDGPNLQGDH